MLAPPPKSWLRPSYHGAVSALYGIHLNYYTCTNTIKSINIGWREGGERKKFILHHMSKYIVCETELTPELTPDRASSRAN